MQKQKIGLILLIVSAIAAITAMLFIDPITQDPAYHNFAGENTILGVPNFWNVFSNLAILIVGLLGFKKLNIQEGTLLLYRLFFLGLILASFGSAYYHYAPDDQTLVWDRLPMTISFMSLFAIVICEFISVRIGTRLFVPLVLLGLSSVLVWNYGAQQDLRMYAMVQFYPMVAIPIIIIFFQSYFNRTSAYWYLLLFYVLAKLLEYFDQQTYDLLHFMSGHPLKHVFAAIGLYILFRAYKKREKRLA